jgi:ABC-2 type transport system permease protein
MMRNTFLIARREYIERIKTKAFLVMTILIPAIMAGSLYLPGIFVSRMSSAAKHLVVAVSDPQTGEIIRRQLEQIRQEEQQERQAIEQKEPQPRRTMPQASRFAVDVDTNTSDAERASLADQVKQKKLDGVIWAPREALAAKRIAFITRDVSSFEENSQIQMSVARALQRETLKGKGLTDPEIDNAQSLVLVAPENPSGGGAGDFKTTFFALVFLITVLYVTVLLYGINVMQAVLEEKSSRVMEVMLASAKPKELMAGKILGVGAVSLTQIGIWVLAGVVFASGGLIANGAELAKAISLKTVLFFVVFYVLGYALYSTLYAAVGAMVNSQQEAQQLQQLVALPLILPLLMLSYIVQYPGAPLSVAASIFPLTSPLIMFARISLQIPPWWQIGASIGVLVITIYGIVLLCARIYRVGILMYGKKPTLPEIMKWIRYA